MKKRKQIKNILKLKVGASISLKLYKKVAAFISASLFNQIRNKIMTEINSINPTIQNYIKNNQEYMDVNEFKRK